LPSMERPTMPMPAGFEAVLKKAMSKKKEDRYADSASFLDALRPYVTGGTVDVPRRPLPGLSVDGGPPPQTLDDHRAATLALPESQLAPLQTAPLQKAAPQKAAPPPKQSKAESDAATRFGALPSMTPLPPQGAPRVLALSPGTSPSVVQPASADPFTVSPRRRKRLSTAGVVVLSLAAVGALVLAAAAVGAVYAVQHGYFDAKKPVGPVMDIGKKDAVTNTAIDEKHKHDLPPVHQLDPIARDEGFHRAEKAIEAGDLIGAKKAYTDALDADPQAPRALIGLATIAMQQHDWAGACDAFEKLSALDAKYARQFGPMYARAKKLRDEQ
ncbi:MAG TPA: tetratricopeptide repeat protein, partial [Myxococcota bacterium]